MTESSSIFMTLINFLLAFALVSAERSNSTQETKDLLKASAHQHAWPEMNLGWRIIIGSIIGFFGAAFGSVGGGGGGGIFVPMLTLIIGFDPKSATATSKCMIMGATVSIVYFNLKLRHPTLDMPIIDYDLVLLIQPVLMLGISIGVSLSVIFADWMVTILLIILCIGTSVKTFFKGVEAWKIETRWKQDSVTFLLESSGSSSESADKTGNEGATKILARQLIRLRQQIANLQGSRAQMRGIATHTQAMRAHSSVAVGMKGASKVMEAMNKVCNIEIYNVRLINAHTEMQVLFHLLKD